MNSPQKFPGIQNPIRIQCLLQPPVHFDRDRADSVFEPSLLREADAVFAGDLTVVGDDPVKEEIERGVGLFAGDGIGLVVFHHEIGVDIAIPRMAEAGHQGRLGSDLSHLPPGEERAIMLPLAGRPLGPSSVRRRSAGAFGC